MNLLAWLFVLTLPVLLIQRKCAGDKAAAKLLHGVLAVTLLILLIFGPGMLIAMIALPFVLFALFSGWVRKP